MCLAGAHISAPWTAQLVQSAEVYGFGQLVEGTFYVPTDELRLLPAEVLPAGSVPIYGFDATFVQIGTAYSNGDMPRFVKRDKVDMASLKRNENVTFLENGDPAALAQAWVASPQDIWTISSIPDANGHYPRITLAQVQPNVPIGVYDVVGGGSPDLAPTTHQTSPWLQWIDDVEMTEADYGMFDGYKNVISREHIPTGQSHVNTVGVVTQYVDTQGRVGIQHCTGFFVGDCWVITAKHCVQDDPAAGNEVARVQSPYGITSNLLSSTFGPGTVLWLDHAVSHPERDQAIIFVPKYRYYNVPELIEFPIPTVPVEPASPDALSALPIEMRFDGSHKYYAAQGVHGWSDTTWSQDVWVSRDDGLTMLTAQNFTIAGSGGYLAGGDSGGPLYMLDGQGNAVLYGLAADSPREDRCYPEMNARYVRVDKAWVSQTLYDSMHDGVFVDYSPVGPLFPVASDCNLPSWAQHAHP